MTTFSTLAEQRLVRTWARVQRGDLTWGEVIDMLVTAYDVAKEYRKDRDAEVYLEGAFLAASRRNMERGWGWTMEQVFRMARSCQT